MTSDKCEMTTVYTLFILYMPSSRQQIPKGCSSRLQSCQRTHGDIFTWGCIKVKNLNLANRYTVYASPSGKMLGKKMVEQLLSVLLECAHVMVMSAE